MPTSCCVPGCDSNYKDDGRIAVFKFPNDVKFRQQRLRSIHRKDVVSSKSSVVCIKHFDECYLVRENSVTRPDGSVLTVKRDRVKLTPNAVPTIFKNQPSYLSVNLPQLRNPPETRENEMLRRQEGKKEKLAALDIIISIKEIVNKYDKSCDLLKNDVFLYQSKDSVQFFNVSKKSKGNLKVSKCISISECLSCTFYCNNIVINTYPKVAGILGGLNILNSWEKLTLLLNCVFEENVDFVTENITTEEHIKIINNSIDILITEHADNTKATTRLMFFKEQINLTFKEKVSYCINTLLWFATVLFAYPAAYNYIRAAKIFTMPRPKYLSKYTLKLGLNNTGLESGTLITYVRKQAFLMIVKKYAVFY
ncbi:uncharacterized protein LOC124368575 [Homalodisca vitripennis]|uniref:uncharacterized protein LOC124368575 n=1 Tax=Homalodisca vitripennis TaxID=197043 RepID=UPI001EEAEA52|nr:uncharacterized protein LOC124368575 [Homalodisca vitripennis]